MPAHRHLLLVVDDDPGSREALTALLATEGFEVATATDGRDALHQLGNGAAPCVILLDINMPGMDGRAFRRVQAADSQVGDVPVIALSGDPHIQDEVRQLCVRDYLVKPVDPDKLLGLIALHCAH
ncbi:MAG TPA: response regulator [Candidatus Binatus sp.]|nr:response regulator [Candidatus Binatus sp.]